MSDSPRRARCTLERGWNHCSGTKQTGFVLINVAAGGLKGTEVEHLQVNNRDILRKRGARVKPGWRGGLTGLRGRAKWELAKVRGRGGHVDPPSWQVSDQVEAVGQCPDGLSSHWWPLVTYMMHLERSECNQSQFTSFSPSRKQASKHASWKELSFQLAYFS